MNQPTHESRGEDQPHMTADSDTNSAPASAARLRRRIGIALVCLVGFAVVAILLIHFMSKSETPELPELPTEPPEAFVEPRFDYDILKDAEYLALNRSVCYSDGTITRELEEAERTTMGAGVALLWDMLDRIIAGDTEGYNALFTQAYIQKNGAHEDFTMQQLYGANAQTGILLEVDRSEVKEEDGRTVTYLLYRVTYRIHKNDGTFRRDIGSDEARPQIILLTDREGGRFKIDSISYRGYRS